MQLDTTIQSFFQSIKNIRWRECEENDRLQWYYAENTYYVVNDKETNAYWFVNAKSPVKACAYALSKLGVAQ